MNALEVEDDEGPRGGQAWSSASGPIATGAGVGSGDVEELVQVLTKFHREVVAPDIERIVGHAEQRLRNEMHTLFDALSQQIQELRTG